MVFYVGETKVLERFVDFFPDGGKIFVGAVILKKRAKIDDGDCMLLIGYAAHVDNIACDF